MRPKRLVLNWLASLAIIAVLLPTPAQACEAGNCVQLTAPLDAETVPTNTLLWVFFDVAGPHEITGTLVHVDSGNEVALDHEVLPMGPLILATPLVLVLRPSEELLPNSTYVLNLDIDADLCAHPGQVIFFTSSGPDTEAPNAPLATGLDAEFVPGMAAIGPCDVGPDRFRYAIDSALPPDSVALRARSVDQIYATTRFDRVVVDIEAEPGTVTAGEDPEIPQRCFSVSAIDIAGNESAPSALICHSNEEPPPVDEGCACGVQERQGSTGFPLGLVLVMLVVRRRPRS